MNESFDRTRRRFIAAAAMTMADAQFHILGGLGAGRASASPALAAAGTTAAGEAESRQLAPLMRAPQWLDAPPASPLLGKVVLVQFGTYTCINWLRTLPYVRAWVRKYGPGLSAIGVHTPEFAFEKHVENVRRAVRGLTLDYPMAVDNDYAIWRAFDNRYWPALYVFDARGSLRHQHFGEGEYERSEKMIQQLLVEAGLSSTGGGGVSLAGTGIEAAADWGSLRSPELYLGHDRTTNFSSPGGAAPGRRRVYRAPPRLALNHWALAGEWTMAGQPVALNTAPGRIVCRFHARDVHLVMGPPPPHGPVRFRIALDGQPPGPAHGADVDDSGSGSAAEQRLHQLVRQPGPIVDRTLEIEYLDAGVEAFAFTFG